ncbi:helix-turn-helix transcriptional regulator [Methylorubrum sp. Q1]|uniref:helix-turn-helix transcriptional regulator n=1 Tax=Methylorubrum sp. Q1 TaxID=2562453 RepID=UPI00352FD529
MHIAVNPSENFNFLGARHFRAARVLLDWTQEDLARNARVVRRTIAMLESGDCRTQPCKVRAVLAALQAAGISFKCGADGKVSLIDANAHAGVDRAPPRCGSGRSERLRTRVSGRRPVAV